MHEGWLVEGLELGGQEGLVEWGKWVSGHSPRPALLPAHLTDAPAVREGTLTRMHTSRSLHGKTGAADAWPCCCCANKPCMLPPTVDLAWMPQLSISCNFRVALVQWLRGETVALWCSLVRTEQSGYNRATVHPALTLIHPPQFASCNTGSTLARKKLCWHGGLAQRRCTRWHGATARNWGGRARQKVSFVQISHTQPTPCLSSRWHQRHAYLLSEAKR